MNVFVFLKDELILCQVSAGGDGEASHQIKRFHSPSKTRRLLQSVKLSFNQ